MSQLDFDKRPILLFWESTHACLLACKHCRADAMPFPAPGELTRDEGFSLIDSLTAFGRPYPVLIMTGGDVLMRPDVFELIDYANQRGVSIGLAPSVTTHLTDENIQRIRQLGVKVVSISLDGASSSVHDGIRGVSGHFDQTVDALRRLVRAGIKVQVNTVAMRANVHELPAVAEILKDVGVGIWEVFYLISVGRGASMQELTPAECEDVAHFLFDVSQHDVIVRTVEGPFFRRVAQWRQNMTSDDAHSPSGIAETFNLGALYESLASELQDRIGPVTSAPRCQTRGTRDGKGILFIAHDGTVYPSGFLPVSLGNIRTAELIDIYREHPLLRDIRATHFSGTCGVCDYRDTCGGSRARAFSVAGDALGDDPSCAYPGFQEL